MTTTKVATLSGAAPGGATIIDFPRDLIAEPSVAELSIASLLIEVVSKARAASSTWQREKLVAQADGFITALSIVLAGECGDWQLAVRQGLVEALRHGVEDPDDLIFKARNPHEPVIA